MRDETLFVLLAAVLALDIVGTFLYLRRNRRMIDPFE